MSASAATRRQTYLPAPVDGHDPRWWLLDGRAGWRPLDGQTADLGAVFALPHAARADRTLTEPGGGFGGLALPSNLAVDDDGTIYLLDREAARLKRFDPCLCTFQTLPCIAGFGKGPRELRTPNGIGIREGNLFVCDGGNQQLKIFALPGQMLRAIWAPPAGSPFAAGWFPYDVAFGDGLVYVSDRANGVIHRFNRTGRWLDPPMGELAGASHLATDREGRLYVAIEDANGNTTVVVVSGDGAVARIDSGKPTLIAGAFDLPPFPVAADGTMSLAAICGLDGDALFDARGDSRQPSAVKPPPLYQREARYESDALDSQIYRCVWHRIVLTGRIPAGARLRIWTYAAETRLTVEGVRNLPDSEWQTGQIVTELDGDWDCLIRNGQGRYLWVRIDLRGNGALTPCLDRIQIEYPRISLSRYLPAVFVAADGDDGDGFTDRFLSLFDTAIRSIEAEIDTQARYFDPLSTPVDDSSAGGRDFLDWLASWIGLTLDRHRTDAQRRQLVKQAARLYHIRGTYEGLRRQLLLYLGWESAPQSAEAPSACGSGRGSCGSGKLRTCHHASANCGPPEPKLAWETPHLILEHFTLRRWFIAGAGRLGDDTVLWGRSIVDRSQLNENAQVDRTRLITAQDPWRDPFHVYAHKFSVFVPAWVERTPAVRRGLETLIAGNAPAHTQAGIRYVAPRFRIGIQASIGLDAVIGCYPEGMTLGETPLGAAAMVPGRTQPRGNLLGAIGGGMRIG